MHLCFPQHELMMWLLSSQKNNKLYFFPHELIACYEQAHFLTECLPVFVNLVSLFLYTLSETLYRLSHFLLKFVSEFGIHF